MPPVGHSLRFSTIAHGGRRILGPVSADRLARLVDRLVLERGDVAVDLGCGKGALLVELMARWPDASAEGFDRNPWFLAEARASATAAGAAIARRISFIETDAPGVSIADRGVAVAIAMGATGIFDGDQTRTVAALADAARPGGIVLFADGFWKREPPAAGLAAFGMARAELADGLGGFTAVGLTAGLEPMSVEAVSDLEWDDYEAAYRASVAAWLATHPSDPEAAAFAARSTSMATSFATWRRDAVGYAIGCFRVPA